MILYIAIGKSIFQATVSPSSMISRPKVTGRIMGTMLVMKRQEMKATSECSSSQQVPVKKVALPTTRPSKAS